MVIVCLPLKNFEVSHSINHILGGDLYARELLEAGVLGPLIAALNPDTSSDRLRLYSLRILNTLFDVCPSEITTETPSIAGTITSEFYTNRQVLKHLEKILSQNSAAPAIQQQISLAATLISKTCRHGGTGEKAVTNLERHQAALVSYGILDALSKQLAGFIARSQQKDDQLSNLSVRRTKASPTDFGLNGLPVAPLSAKLGPIVDALSVIIKYNSHRAFDLLYSPWIVNAFPSNYVKKDVSAKPKTGTTNTQARLNAAVAAGGTATPSVISSSAFPPLAAAAAFFPAGGQRGPSLLSDLMGDIESSVGTPAVGSDIEDEDQPGKRRQLDAVTLEESALVRWLITQCRTGDALTRLMTISLLTNICQIQMTGPISKDIEQKVLPILVRLLDDDPSQPTGGEGHKGGASVGGHTLPQSAIWTIQERAPGVLADLINDNEPMQKSAVVAGAIKKLAGMLKKSFDDVPNPALANGSTGWASGVQYDPKENSRLIKDSVHSPFKTHRVRVRESTLRCLAGLTSIRDEFKKLVIDAGVIPYYVAALKPIVQRKDPGPSAPAEDEEEASSSNKINNKDGNPNRVLIAAAYAIKSLSRSVSILRTSLVDAQVAGPLVRLMTDNDDVEVKIAATMAICNLVLEFSPMRQGILDMGILKILCEQAHSTNADLKLNSVWALKHLVYAAENDVKTTALTQLGTAWLVDLIGWDEGGAFDEEDEQLYADEDEGMDDDGADQVALRSESPYAMPSGDQKSGNDTDMEGMRFNIGQLGGFATSFSPDEAASLVLQQEIASRAFQRTKQQLIKVQEQGLDFLRNLICGNDSTDILDQLFTGVGQERVYEILAQKLRPKPLAGRISGRSSRRPTTASSMESASGFGPSRQPSPEILVPVIYILVHIAANHPRHRQTLIQQTDLLSALIPLFDHERPEVRVGLAWLVINLTWKDDGADEGSCKSRATELRRLGFVDKLEALLTDKQLDVRERAKTGLYQIRLCLGEA